MNLNVTYTRWAFLTTLLTKAVLNVQKECLKLCYEDGVKTLDDIHRQSVEHLTRELRNLNIHGVGYRVRQRIFPF